MDNRKDKSYIAAPAPLNDRDANLTSLLADAEARQLVQAAQEYDKAALSRIYRVFADRIYRYIYYRVGDRNRAEELTGEVFVRLLENIGAFRFGTKGHTLALTGWIYRIAHNLVVDEYRRKKRSESETLPEDLEDNFEPDGQIEIQLTRADLQVALQRLTEEQQTVVLLRFDAGYTSGEIAIMLGKSETAIKALQRRAVATLSRLLTGQRIQDGEAG